MLVLLEASEVESASIIPFIYNGIETLSVASGWCGRYDDDVGEVELQFEVVQVLSFAYLRFSSFRSEVADFFPDFEGVVLYGVVGEHEVEGEHVVDAVSF